MMKSRPQRQTDKTELICPACGDRRTLLPQERARIHCSALMRQLALLERIDVDSPLASPGFSTAELFGLARGKMFGVLTGCDSEGEEVVLKAFSGQYNGHWEVRGWAPPLFNVKKWHAVNGPVEREIKQLGHALQEEEPGSPRHRELKRERRDLSRRLMQELHALYTLKNFRGEEAPLGTFFSHQGGIPTGAGDCCAPKLLNYAVQRGITPTGMAEFYWGRTNRSASKEHGSYYPACLEKCQPILGFLLCGLPQGSPSR